MKMGLNNFMAICEFVNQSVPNIIKDVSSNPAYCEVYSKQLFGIKFVSCLWQVWFSLGAPVSSTNKTYCHDIAEILLNVALNTINQPTNQM
jgi:hypothetical protein